jgi:membrane-bound lytic murein transglycosylase B
MTRFTAIVLCLAFVLASPFSISQSTYVERAEVKVFVDHMVKKHNFDEQQLNSWLASAQRKQSILDAISRPAEKTKPWKDYRKIFITSDRINKGVTFWQNHKKILDEVSSKYGVDPEIIVAILGVETRYGDITGSYRVIDALATLGFDYPPRASFFKKQLEEFFLLSREQNQNPLSLKGSYAGAMGYGQFIPSSYRHYAVDHDGDGFADIWNNPTDAIASVANYFREHGWQYGKAIASKAYTRGEVKSQIVSNNLKPAHSMPDLKTFMSSVATIIHGCTHSLSCNSVRQLKRASTKLSSSSC